MTDLDATPDGRSPTNRPRGPLVGARMVPTGVSLVLASALALGISATASAQPSPRKADFDMSGISAAGDVDRHIEAALILLTNDARVSEDYAIARDHLEEAIAVDPTRAATYYEVAEIYRDRIDVEESWYYFEQFVSLAPRRDHRWYRANLLLGTRIAERIAMLGYGPTHLVEGAEAHFLAAYEYARESRSPERMRDLEPKLSMLAVMKGDLEASLRYLRAHVQHFPISPFDTHLFIAKHLNWLGRSDEALEYIEAVPTDLPDPYYSQRDQRFARALTMAQIHRELGNSDTALQYLDIAEQDFRFLLREQDLTQTGPSPSTPYAYELSQVASERGSVYLVTGQHELAVDSFREAHDFRPDEGGKNNLAWAMAVASEPGDDRLQEALSLASEAVATVPSPAYLDTLAEVELRLGLYDDAIVSIERALDARPDSQYLQTQRARIERLRDGEALAPGDIHLHRPWSPPVEGL